MPKIEPFHNAQEKFKFTNNYISSKTDYNIRNPIADFKYQIDDSAITIVRARNFGYNLTATIAKESYDQAKTA